MLDCFPLPAAFCKNSIDGQWYCFDDSEVQPMPDEEVCHQTAYILFYQRRATIPSWSANSSVAGKPSKSLTWLILPIVPTDTMPLVMPLVMP